MALTPDARSLPLAQRWTNRWSEISPVDRFQPRDRHARFHYLPDERRDPRTAAELEIAMDRFYAVLGALRETSDDRSLVLILVDYPPGDGYTDWHLDVVPHAWQWQTGVGANPDPDPEWDDPGVHLWVEEGFTEPEQLRPLLELVVRDEAGQLTLTNNSFDWRWQPYDGGMDSFAPSTVHRDELVARFSEWHADVSWLFSDSPD